jgi:hypothetical protein
MGGGWRPGTPIKDITNGKTAFTLSIGFPAFGKHIVKSNGTAYTLSYSGRGAENMVMDVVDPRDLTVMTLMWISPVDIRKRRFPLGEAVLTGRYEPDEDIVLLMTLAFHVFQCHLQPLQGG